jgi:hypothetical protein
VTHARLSSSIAQIRVSALQRRGGIFRRGFKAVVPENKIFLINFNVEFLDSLLNVLPKISVLVELSPALAAVI